MKKFLISILILISSLVKAQTYTLTFILTDLGQPVPNATIKCDSVSKNSDSTGTIVFIVPIKTNTISKYKYTLRKPGYISMNDSVSMKASKTIFIYMKPITYMILFQVSDGVKPMQGVFINFNNQVVQVDSMNGNYLFNPVRMADSLEYTIAKSDYKTLKGKVPVIKNAAYTFYMTKNNTSMATFYVNKLYDSIPIKDARIVINKDTFYTNDLGKALITNLPIKDSLMCKVYKQDYNTETLYLNTNNDIENVVYLDSLRVNFLVTNGSSYIKEADINFHNIIKYTNDSGIAVFRNIMVDRGLPYIVNKRGYKTFSGNIDIEDINVSVTVILIVSSDASGQFLLENYDVKEIYVYPNPLYGDLFINSSMKIKSLYIVDMLGHPVKIIDEPSASLLMIDTEDMNSGVYIIKITTADNHVMTFKITKG